MSRRLCEVALRILQVGCLLILSWTTNANEAEWFLKNAPTHYQVKKGDTLWEISCKFLHDPWRWPQILAHNRNIENPNLIYPGDEITLSYQAGKPKLHLQRAQITKITRTIKRTITLHPHVRILPADRAIPTIPLKVIEPFLNESRVITADQAANSPKIIALDEDHLVVGRGDLLYVTGMTPRWNDDVYAVFRTGKTYLHPHTDALLGLEGLVLGKVSVQVPGDPARLQVLESFEEIRIGDKILPTLHEELDPYFMPKYPNGNAGGQIVSVFGGVNQIAQFQILVITGGKDSQREIGDVLAIYQTQKDTPPRITYDTGKIYQFPPLKIGRCIIFRVFDKVSYVLVMKATRPIYLLDQVGKP